MHTYADQVREYARRTYIEPARAGGAQTVRLVAGEVQKGVHLSNRVALVCQALKSRKFLSENRLSLEKWEGPPSGMSTTVTFTYRLETRAEERDGHGEWPFLHLRGVARDIFRELGGGEQFLRNERERFYGADGDS